MGTSASITEEAAKEISSGNTANCYTSDYDFLPRSTTFAPVAFSTQAKQQQYFGGNNSQDSNNAPMQFNQDLHYLYQSNMVHNQNFQPPQATESKLPFRVSAENQHPQYFTNLPNNLQQSNNPNAIFQQQQQQQSFFHTPTSNMEMISLRTPNATSNPTPPATEDAFRWRKYGSKNGKDFNRAYFKCCHPNCPAKKVLETHNDTQNVVYREAHTHDPPAVKELRANSQGEFRKIVFTHFHNSSSGSPGKGSDSDNTPSPNGTTTSSHSKLVVELSLNVSPHEDGYAWRKYGQKAVKGSTFPRSYYKCSYPSCPVKKQIVRKGNTHQCSYSGIHSHDVPNDSDSASSDSQEEINTSMETLSNSQDDANVNSSLTGKRKEREALPLGDLDEPPAKKIFQGVPQMC